MTFFSRSVIIRDFRSGPAITRAIASSSSSWPIAFLLLRAARIAASLIRLLRSAPLNPGVCRARTSRSTWPSKGLLRAWTSGIARRPRMSGARDTDANEQLDEFRARDAEERDAGLAGDRLGQQRLPGTGRADHQHALGNPGAERGEFFRELEELDDLGELLFGLLHAGDVVEGNRRFFTGEQAGAAASERDRLVVAALRLAQHVPHEAADHQEEDDVRQDDREQQVRGAGGLGVEGDVELEQLRLDLEGVAEGRLETVPAAVGPIDFRSVALDRSLLDVVIARRLDQLRGRLIRGRRDRVEALVTGPDDRQQTSEQNEVEDVAVSASHGQVILTPGF